MGGHGVTGSADPFQVGVILGYPGERADPFGQEVASVIDTSVVAEDVIKLPTSSSEQASPRQPPTVSDTTAAAFLRSTQFSHYPNSHCFSRQGGHDQYREIWHRKAQRGLKGKG